jgi:predicted HicB family RNase H-like nuclease
MIDNKETVEIRVDQEELFKWMLAAHALDITLNEFAERALVAFVQQHGEQNE